MTEDDVLLSYEAILHLMHAMVTSARARDWQRLEWLEGQCRPLTQRLMSSEDTVLLSAAGAQKKFSYLRQILEDDGLIRQETEPWMAQLKGLMQSNDAQKKLNQTYRQGYV